MKLFGLIGYPLSHSFSKKYFKKKFQKEGIVADYLNFEIENISELKSILVENPTLCGLNVTIPHKENIIPLLDKMSKEALAIGAVNTIKISNEGNLEGFNTDVFGFVSSIKPLLKTHHKKALVLGTGGSSKAIVYGLNQLKIKSKLVSRSSKKEADFTYNHLSLEIIQEHQIIINCTPLGMYPNISSLPDIPYQHISEDHLLFDLVYNPDETEFLKKGKTQGATVKNGLEMLQVQAHKSWEIWTR